MKQSEIPETISSLDSFGQTRMMVGADLFSNGRLFFLSFSYTCA